MHVGGCLRLGYSLFWLFRRFFFYDLMDDVLSWFSKDKGAFRLYHLRLWRFIHMYIQFFCFLSSLIFLAEGNSRRFLLTDRSILRIFLDSNSSLFKIHPRLSFSFLDIRNMFRIKYNLSIFIHWYF